MIEIAVHSGPKTSKTSKNWNLNNQEQHEQVDYNKWRDRITLHLRQVNSKNKTICSTFRVDNKLLLLQENKSVLNTEHKMQTVVVNAQEKVKTKYVSTQRES